MDDDNIISITKGKLDNHIIVKFRNNMWACNCHDPAKYKRPVPNLRPISGWGNG